MSEVQELPELVGKFIKSASIKKHTETGDEEFVALLSDGTTLVVGAWQKEGSAIEMNAEVQPRQE